MNARRKRRVFSKLKDAKAEAEIRVNQFTSGNFDVGRDKNSDRAACQRAIELLTPFDIPLEAAVADYVQIRKSLGTIPPASAVEYYLSRNDAVDWGAQAAGLLCWAARPTLRHTMFSHTLL